VALVLRYNIPFVLYWCSFFSAFFLTREFHIGFPPKFKFGPYQKKARFFTIPTMYNFLCALAENLSQIKKEARNLSELIERWFASSQKFTARFQRALEKQIKLLKFKFQLTPYQILGDECCLFH